MAETTGSDERQAVVARIYSDAIFDVASKQEATESLLEELEELLRFLDQREDLAVVLLSPMVDTEDRAELLEKLFRGRASDLLVDSLQVVNRKGRLDHLRGIVASYRHTCQEKRGMVDVELRTAVPLSDDLRRSFEERVRRFTGKEPRLQPVVDPALLGGFVLRLEDTKIDASVARELTRLRHALLERASQEIHDRADAYFSDVSE